MKKLSLCVLLLVISSTVVLHAQPSGPWSINPGSAGDDYGQMVATDGSGNVFVVGSFRSASIDFGTGTLTNAGSGFDDVYVVKYSPGGTALWARRAGGTNHDVAWGVSVDATGTSYVVGSFSSTTIDFGTGALTNAGSTDLFVVKYDPGGTVLWARRAGGTDAEFARSVAMDTAGNIYVTGYFASSTIDLGTGALTNAGSTDLFIVKYNPSGVALWARQAGSIGNDYGVGIAVDDSCNSYLSGMFTSATINFGTGVLTNAGADDIFIVKYDPGGTALWAKRAGGTGNDDGTMVSVDGSGNSYLTGYFGSTTIDFGTGVLTNAGNLDIFIVKYSPGGTALWARRAGGTDLELSYNATVDAAGNCYISGIFRSSPLDMGVGSLTNRGADDILILKYDPEGSILWAGCAGGTGYDSPKGICADTSHNIYLVGGFNSPALNLGTGVLTNAGGGDIFVAKFSENPQISSVSDIPADQGGEVRLTWYGSKLDLADAVPPVTSYAVWRKVPGSLMAAGYKRPVPTEGIPFAENDFGDYDYLTSIPAVQSLSYNVVVPTLGDSSAGGIPYFSYMITAHTDDIYHYYLSMIDSGYSVDNLEPVPPAGLVATMMPGPQVVLSWNPPTDSDVGHYNVFRSTMIGFTPEAGNKIGTSGTIGYTDTSPVEGVPSYYKVVAVDIHDNESTPSNEAQAAVYTTSEFNVQAKWNLISVPLRMSDYTKTVLFPTATTGAFAYEDGYFGYATLENGRGYWLKFAGAEMISHSGLVRPDDTIAVAAGWNMIGSLSSSIPVSNVGSIPGGIVTSAFFGYEGGYISSMILEPGKGYWVKAAQPGQLVLSSTTSIPAAQRVRVEITGESPPPPPDELSAGVPDECALGQNYPNPFNPITRIRYALDVGAHVRLSVYNMLGQEVALLVNEVQEAGLRSATFDASGLPSGIYTYRISAGTFTDVKKMLLLK